VAVLARAAEGSLRDGLSLLEQAISYSGDAITDEQVRELLGVVAESVLDNLVDAISQQSAELALGLVHRLIGDGQNLQHFCREAIRHFRNLLVARVCGPESDLVAAPQDERPRLAEQAARFSEEDLTRFFNTLLATDAELRRAPDPRLHLELGLLKLINARRLAPLEEVLAELRGEARAASSTAGSPSRATASAANARSVSSVSGVAVRMAPESNPSGSTGSSVVRPSKAASAEVIQPAKPKISEPRMSEIRSSPAPIPASPPRMVARAAEDSTNGLASAQVEAIKAALQGQKFLWSMLDAVTRWEVENGELRLFFPTESRSLAEMLQSRDPMERLRTVLNQVVGQPLRVCVKLDSSRAAAPAGRGSDLRARLEEDPIVRAMLEKFGGQISNVKRPGEEN
jgi:DNA polymerase-3 subunit gamma/tau